MVGDIFISNGVRGSEGAGENGPLFTRFICLSNNFSCIIALVSIYHISLWCDRFCVKTFGQCIPNSLPVIRDTYEANPRKSS